MTPAREQIVTAAHAAGWTTDPGYHANTQAGMSAGWSGTAPDGYGLHVEFSSAGGITYAAGGHGRDSRRMSGTGRLARVLAAVADHGEVQETLPGSDAEQLRRNRVSDQQDQLPPKAELTDEPRQLSLRELRAANRRAAYDRGNKTAAQIAAGWRANATALRNRSGALVPGAGDMLARELRAKADAYDECARELMTDLDGMLS